MGILTATIFSRSTCKYHEYNLEIKAILIYVFLCHVSADKLQVIAMRGKMGEEVPFFAHLEAQKKSTIWLKLLEGIMKNTIATVLQACVQTRMEDGMCEEYVLTVFLISVNSQYGDHINSQYGDHV